MRNNRNCLFIVALCAQLDGRGLASEKAADFVGEIGMQRVTLIDNYDSFTFNLVHYLGELGADVSVWRNDEITVADALADKPDAIVLSPGPCTPNEAGVCLDLVRAASETTPIARGLPWPSGDRAGIRRRRRARARADARQGVAHFAQCARALPRSERPVLLRRAITRSSSSDRARLPSSRSAPRAMMASSWGSSTETARRSVCSFIRKASQASMVGRSCIISSTSPAPFISASKPSDRETRIWNPSSL